MIKLILALGRLWARVVALAEAWAGLPKQAGAKHGLFPPVAAESLVPADEWGAYRHLGEADRVHLTVCHAPGKRECARDEDGDGVREVHSNTLEGFGTGSRDFLRPFQGVN